MTTRNDSNDRLANGAISPAPPVSHELAEMDVAASAKGVPQVVATESVAKNVAERRGAPFHQQPRSGEIAQCKAAAEADAWRVSPAEISQVLTFVEHGYSLRQAAGAVGRSHSTFVKLRRRDPKFDRDYRQHRELARDKPLLQVRRAAEQSWRAAAWLLKYLDAQERSPRGKK
jgi:hypothetical protein